MGRRPCCGKEGLNRGAWSAREDKLLINYINVHGEGKWRDLPQKAGLRRCGKSCRLRWLNYLRPDIKRGNISEEEEDLIIRLHKLLGNRWSLIAGRLPGRTDNEIKNYWHTNLSKGVGTCNMQLHKCTKTGRTRNYTMRSRTAEAHEVIRTKAVRCTKVVIPQLVDNQKLDIHSEVSPSAAVQQEDNSASPVWDFNISDLLIPGVLSSGSPQGKEISTESGYHKVMEGGYYGLENVPYYPDCPHFAHGATFDHLMDESVPENQWVSHDPFKEILDLESLASFLNSEDE